MKRLLCISLTVLLLMGLTACDKQPTNPTTQAAEVALVISEKGALTINTFNRLTYEGITRYCEENAITYAAYEPEIRHYEEDYLRVVDEAVKAGAKVIVCPGYLLETTVMRAQDAYPDVRFILIDGVPNNGNYSAYEEKIGENTYALLFAEEQAGFLAGYAAVKDGYRNLGFFGGMEVPAVTRFGYGYIQGAEYAAEELGLEDGAVQLRYLYCGDFNPSPEFQAKAASWYLQGTEVIFACGGAIGQSVMQAAAAQGGYVIGVDTDQSGDSETVITSALKMIDISIYNALLEYYGEQFPGGQSRFVGAEADGVGLPMATSRFKQFTEADYEAIYEALVNDTDGLASGLIKDDKTIGEIPTRAVKVTLESLR